LRADALIGVWPAGAHVPRTQGSRRALSILKWIGIVLASLVVLVVLFLALADWNAMKRPIERIASNTLGREVSIAGDLDVHPWSWTPQVTVSDVTVGNADWDRKSKPTMATIERLDLRLKLLPLLKGDVVLPLVDVTRPQIYAHREESGRANWDFGREDTGAERNEAAHLPVIRELIVDDGRLEVRDDERKLVFHGTVEAHESPAHAERKPFHLEGEGELNGKPFDAKVSGGPLLGLDAGDPYPFTLGVHASDIRVEAQGVVPKPFDLATVQVKLKASGNDLADLYYLTGLAIPNTPPYDVAASVERKGATIHVKDLEGKFGRSDMRGSLDVDMSGERPKVTGKVESQLLDLKDIMAAFGARKDPKTAANAAETASSVANAGDATDENAPDAAPEDAATGNAEANGDANGDAAQPAPPAPATRVFPDARLQVNRVRGMDADVEYSAAKINAGTAPMEHASVHVVLDNGLLSADPFSVTMPQGKLAGTARIDARADVPRTDVDMRITDLDLEQFKGSSPDSTPPLAGTLQARAVMQGTGASVHEFVSNASGTVTAVVPHGEVRAALAELTGINVLRGLGLLLTDDQQRAEVRCGVANFAVENGVMRAEHVVFDTTDVLITGGGELRLGPEELALEVKGHPKKPRLVRLNAPIELDGTLRDPNLHVEAGQAAKQAGIAAAIGAIIAPVAALFAFVDRGLADDANCAALLAEANSEGVPTPGS
jgi:uncharacterized protein involved in outer membrane biogenesis